MRAVAGTSIFRFQKLRKEAEKEQKVGAILKDFVCQSKSRNPRCSASSGSWLKQSICLRAPFVKELDEDERIAMQDERNSAASRCMTPRQPAGNPRPSLCVRHRTLIEGFEDNLARFDLDYNEVGMVAALCRICILTLHCSQWLLVDVKLASTTCDLETWYSRVLHMLPQVCVLDCHHDHACGDTHLSLFTVR